MLAFATAILSAAFLLFIVQPLTARRLLPWFGGSPAVWIVSLLFFQTILFMGYVYARLICRYLDGRRQAIVHGAVLLTTFLFLPLGPDRPAAMIEAPRAELLWMLARHVGPPLIVLSATSPLLQAWLASTARASASVYRLFAMSNFGSLFGLLSYPFLVEPYVSLSRQVEWWSFGYVMFGAATLFCATTAFRTSGPPSPSERLEAGWGERMLWLALAATGSMLLMATSSQLTQNVAAVPFLWVVPLGLYLGSFIIAFERDRWYHRLGWGGAWVIGLLWLLHIVGQPEEADLVIQVAAYSIVLITGCVICHGELARLRPATERLTTFYLLVALGGLLGGAFVGLLAPSIFARFWEYPIALFGVWIVGGASMPLDRLPRIYWSVGSVALALLLSMTFAGATGDSLIEDRGFFGAVRVYDDRSAGVRYLLNGPVTHGGELLDPEARTRPILYYGPGTGVSLALEYDASRPRRVGVIGLGAGALAAYGNADDRYTFFELNPQVVDIARRMFHFLEDSAAEIEILVGDARLRLTASEPLALDVLVVDAFAGDAIPVHLLTKEAFAVYQRHLAPDGILAVHVSNLHFDLEPVVRAQARAMGAVSVLVLSDADDSQHAFATDWVLVTTNGAFLADPDLSIFWEPRAAEVIETGEPVATDTRLWTDDFTDLFGALR